MRTHGEWRAYINARAELHCRLCGLLPDDQPLASIQPPGLATILGALCAHLVHIAMESELSEQETEQALERVLWNRIRHDEEAA